MPKYPSNNYLSQLAGTMPNEVEVTSSNISLPSYVDISKKKKKNIEHTHQTYKSHLTNYVLMCLCQIRSNMRILNCLK